MKALVRAPGLLFVFILVFASIQAAAQERERDPLPLKDWRVDLSSFQREDSRSFIPQPNAVPSEASHFVSMVPCRILDTRLAAGPYGGPKFASEETRTYDILGSACSGIPSNASAYSLNIAVTEVIQRGFVTAWNSGVPRPLVSVLNYDYINATISNGIIIPAGTGGAIDIYTLQSAHIVVDINGYFAEGVVTDLTAGAGLTGGGTGAVSLAIANEGVTPAMVDPTGSSPGDVLTSDGSDVSWAAPPSLTGAAGGDLSGNYPNPTIASTAGNNIITAINAGTGTIDAARVASADAFVLLSPATTQATTDTGDVIDVKLNVPATTLGTSGTDDLLSLSAAGVYGGTPLDKERFRVDNSGGVLAVGGDDGTIPATGAGTRMMFHANKAAFRVGQVNGTQWDDSNVAVRSFAAGRNTTASGNQSAAFGNGSVASGQEAFAAGDSVTAGGKGSVALGTDATTSHDGSFVFGDNSGGTTVTTSGNNQFRVRAEGGTIFYSNATLGAGVTLAPGGGGWGSVSDRNRKENFQPVDGENVLLRIRSIPISTWNYRSQNAAIRHIGPMSQDFYAAFGVGEDERLINTVDIDGVNLAAVQALESRTFAQQAEIESLKQRNAELEERLRRLEALIAAGPRR